MSILTRVAPQSRPIGTWPRIKCDLAPVRRRPQTLRPIRPSGASPKAAQAHPLAASPRSGLLDPESPAIMLGEPSGIFDDFWVRQNAVFTFRAQATITSMSVELWVPPEADPFALSLHLADEPECMLTAHAGQVAVLQYPVFAVPFTEFSVELVAAREWQLDPPDRRQGAYKIRAVSLC